jgi:HSP20 family protein
MDAKQNVATREGSSVGQPESRSTAEGRRREVGAIAPAVDIFEDAHQIIVQAEMPGVSKGALNVRADHNSLLIEGDATLDMPPGMSALYADMQTTKYRRTFVLSSELETERIEASLKDGLLTVRIPKRMEFRTRKIKVNVP